MFQEHLGEVNRYAEERAHDNFRVLATSYLDSHCNQQECEERRRVRYAEQRRVIERDVQREEERIDARAALARLYAEIGTGVGEGERERDIGTGGGNGGGGNQGGAEERGREREGEGESVVDRDVAHVLSLLPPFTTWRQAVTDFRQYTARETAMYQSEAERCRGMGGNFDEEESERERQRQKEERIRRFEETHGVQVSQIEYSGMRVGQGGREREMTGYEERSNEGGRERQGYSDENEDEETSEGFSPSERERQREIDAARRGPYSVGRKRG
ncbi:hypothetical protein KIPB_009095 [Kipferlia bialata]|uniref:Uncharacterized protein n=1 Tax=Kipferlia bialata TaxID=797122 RepID=A0A9K3D1Q6_9EUKA|nr:hypothetical protein KIPB_009095 [Kipferlia bialata]|eukprot:g9095.t1